MPVSLSVQNYQINNYPKSQLSPYRGKKNTLSCDTVSFKANAASVRDGKDVVKEFVSFISRHNPFSSSAVSSVTHEKKPVKSLELTPEHFFIKIPGYGRDKIWGEGIASATNMASELIARGKKMDEVLKFITNNLKLYESDTDKMRKIGVLRTDRPGWNSDKRLADLYRQLQYNYAPYSAYEKRYDKMVQNKKWEVMDSSMAFVDARRSISVSNPFNNFAVTEICNEGILAADTMEPVKHGAFEKYLKFPHGVYASNALDRVEKIYNHINQKFRTKIITEKDLPLINENVAEIHWIMTQSMPWGRGTDATANSFVKAIYKSLAIKTYPPRKGLSFDLEAFCTELKDYKKNYASYYEKPPELV